MRSRREACLFAYPLKHFLLPDTAQRRDLPCGGAARPQQLGSHGVHLPLPLPSARDFGNGDMMAAHANQPADESGEFHHSCRFRATTEPSLNSAAVWRKAWNLRQYIAKLVLKFTLVAFNVVGGCKEYKVKIIHTRSKTCFCPSYIILEYNFFFILASRWSMLPVLLRSFKKHLNFLWMQSQEWWQCVLCERIYFSQLMPCVTVLSRRYLSMMYRMEC